MLFHSLKLFGFTYVFFHVLVCFLNCSIMISPTHIMSSMPVAFLNVCSLRCKVREIEQLIASRGIMMMCLAETWLDEGVTNGELTIPHFTLHRKDRGSHSGGVAVYTHESLAVRRRSELECKDLELLWLEVSTDNHKHIFGCGYRSPSEHASYRERLESNLDGVVERPAESVTLVGISVLIYLAPRLSLFCRYSLVWVWSTM